jgi:putative phosphoribosyl transferase
MQFLDRRDAGEQLAAELMPLAAEQPVIVALARGGVVVAVQVARALRAPIDILAVRKIGAPGNPELAVGAVAEEGAGVIDPRSAERLGMTEELLDARLHEESRELQRGVARYRSGQPPMPLDGRVAIVVDDGMATGMTELAAVRAVRARGAARVVVAVPVASGEAVAMLEEEADRVICLTIPRRLYGVGMWYADFAPVSDEEVLALVTDARSEERTQTLDADEEELGFDLDGVRLRTNLILPASARGLIVFAHGSGSSRFSPRNQSVARALAGAGFGSLLLDLLTEPESRQRELTFDISLLSARLAQLTREASAHPRLRAFSIGYFGASTGAAAALCSAAALGDAVAAVVSRGGRPDLAGAALGRVTSPTRLIVGQRDPEVLELNRDAARSLRCPHEVSVVDGAGHLFEEPGALDRVAELAIEWFERYVR